MKTSDRVQELFLSYACQAKCAFCYNPPLTEEILRKEIPFDRAAKTLFEGRASGAERLNLHGGEITLRDDLPKLVALARKMGYRTVEVVTNGIRLAESVYTEKLVRCGANAFRFSIHSDRPAVHDAIVEVPGAYERARTAWESLGRFEGVRRSINLVAHRDNAQGLPETVHSLFEAWTPADLIVYAPHYRGLAAIHADRIGLRPLSWLPGLLAGLDAWDEEKRVLLANIPPCWAPRHVDRILDWSVEESASGSLSGPDGSPAEIPEMKAGQRRQGPNCGECVLADRCEGIDTEYAERFGFEELRPKALVAIPAGGLP